jgi:hypothetical protein
MERCMEADSIESISTAPERFARRTRKLVSKACGKHARMIKVYTALGGALLLFSVSSDAFAPLRQWMITAFEAEYRTPGQAGLDHDDAPSATKSQKADDAAIRVALAHVGLIRLAGSGESGDIFWTTSDRINTSSEYQAEHDRARSDGYRSGFIAAQGYGAGGHRSRMLSRAFGLPLHLYPSQQLAGVAGPAGRLLSGGSLSQGDSDPQPQDNPRGGDIHPALEEGPDGDTNQQRTDFGADVGPLGAPNDELLIDNARQSGDPIVAGADPNANAAPLSLLDDGLVKEIDEPVLQDLTLPHNGGIAKSSTGEEDYPDLTQLSVSDASVAAITSVPLPGTLAMIVLGLPMLVSFHGRFTSKRR